VQLEAATAMHDKSFWAALDRLVAAHVLTIERPEGTMDAAEPGFVYPMDYGFLAGTVSTDGAGIDVWVGSLATRRVTGVVYTVDEKKADVEVKLLIGCTRAEARQALLVHSRGLQSAMLVERPDTA